MDVFDNIVSDADDDRRTRAWASLCIRDLYKV